MDYSQKDKYEMLGINISFYRKVNKFTQLQLCEILDIDRSYLSKIELGNVGVSLDIIFKLSDILEVPVDKFFDFKNIKPS